MNVRSDIPLNIKSIISAIFERQNASWNGGIYYSNYDYSILQQFFEHMNSGIEVDDYFYKGDIYRIHCRSERGVLPITEYTNNLSSFSKSYDFTKECYYKVSKAGQAVLFRFNTGNKFGLDINAFLHKFGYRNEWFEDEQEILFPFCNDFVIKEYHCTPNQFKYYMRGVDDVNENHRNKNKSI